MRGAALGLAAALLACAKDRPAADVCGPDPAGAASARPTAVDGTDAAPPLPSGGILVDAGAPPAARGEVLVVRLAASSARLAPGGDVRLDMSFQNTGPETVDLALPWPGWTFFGTLVIDPSPAAGPPPWVSKPGVYPGELHTIEPGVSLEVPLRVHRTRDGRAVCIVGARDLSGQAARDPEGCEQRLTLAGDDALSVRVRVSDDGSFAPSEREPGHPRAPRRRWTGTATSNAVTLVLR